MNHDPVRYIRILRELAVRIVSPAFDNRGPGQEPQILVGELPRDLPIEIPFPKGARLLGSYVDPEKRITGYLDVPMSRDEVFVYYRDWLTTKGWTRIESEPRLGGIQERPPRPPHPTNGGTYCRSAVGPAIMLQGLENSDHTTQLRLYVDRNAQVCARPGNPPGSDPTVPVLSPPPNMEWLPRSSAGGQDAGSFWGHLISDLDPSVVLMHYASQLEGKGWKRASGDVDGSYIWETWTYSNRDMPDRRGVVFLSLLHHVGPYPRFPFGRGLTEHPKMVSQYAVEVHALWSGGE